jgi:4-amino-4-deoxy-L-arabinose transferase-like glycosyltransferase
VLFFSSSGSKLAPYILPMMPPLAVIVGVHLAARPNYVRRLAQFNGVFLPLLAGGFVLFALRRYGFVPPSASPWLVGAAIAAFGGVVTTWNAEPAGALRPVWAAAASAILGWQCLVSAFTELPERSAYKLVMTVRNVVGPETELFSIGQYRETISPYLQRTLTLVDFEGELAFGLAQEPAGALTREAFLSRWNAATNAVVFLDPRILGDWRQRGLQGKVIGGDNETLAVSRQ